MAVRVSAENFEQEVLQAQGAVLADFYSDSCLPCKRMAPLLAELEESTDGLKLVKINIAYAPELTEQYQIQAAPTLVLFENGAEIGRLRGAVRKDEILSLLHHEI